MSQSYRALLSPGVEPLLTSEGSIVPEATTFFFIEWQPALSPLFGSKLLTAQGGAAFSIDIRHLLHRAPAYKILFVDILGRAA